MAHDELSQIRIVEAEDNQTEDFSHLIEEFGLNEEFTKASWICVGGGATNFVRLLLDALDPREHEFTRILGANTDVQQFRVLLKGNPPRPLFLPGWAKRAKEGAFRLVRLGDTGGAGGRPEVAAELTRAKAQEIREFFEETRIGLLVANLGGGTGSGAAPEIAEMLGKEKDSVGGMAVLMTPFGYEGEDRFKRAEEAHAKVTEHIAALTLRNQALYEIAGDKRYPRLAEELKTADTGKAIALVNKYGLQPIIETIDQLVLHAASTINRDPADFKRLVQSGKTLYMRSYHSNEEGAPEDKEGIVDHLLNNPFLSGGIIPNSKLGMILFRGFANEDSGYIAEQVRNAMKGDDPGKSVELIPGHDTGDGNSRSIFFMAVAEEELNFEDLKKETRKTVHSRFSFNLPPAKTPASFNQSASFKMDTVSTEELVSITIGLAGPRNEVDIVERSLPQTLAKEIQAFVNEYRHAPLPERQGKWRELQNLSKPYLKGKEMAPLCPFRFTNSTGMRISWHVTPVLMEKYRRLERQCRLREGTKEDAKEKFEALCAEWKAETGHEISIDSSLLFQQAFGAVRPAPGMLGSIRKRLNQS